MERFPSLRGQRPEQRLIGEIQEEYLAQNYRLGRLWQSPDTCQLCRQWIGPEGFQHDHVIPWKAGGCSHDHNLRIVHPICNSNRSNYLSAMVFHCPGCLHEANICWNRTIDEYGRTEWFRTWRRNHRYHQKVTTRWLSHDGQDQLW